MATRLRTESEFSAEASWSAAEKELTVAAAEESVVLNERYSCIMYRGYPPRGLNVMFLKPFSTTAWVPTTKPKTELQKTKETSEKSICTARL